MTRRVGLLGGTFDPPHLAHLVVAEHARVLLGLDEVRLLVAGEPWMKDEITPAAHRVAMAQVAIADHGQILVDGRETRRVGPTYTADTLADLTVEEPDTTFSFLLGADAAARVSQWHRAEEALALASFVAVTRPGHTPDPSVDMTDLEVPLLAISSTDLRARYRDGRPTRWLLPDAVDRYVREHDLYGADRRRPRRSLH